MKLYHLSKTNMNDDRIVPKIPSNYFTKNGYEDGSKPRVCFSTSIDGCLRGLSQNLKNEEYYVHVPDGYYKTYKPSIKEVPDCEITGELWITKPVDLKCIGKIKVIKDKGEDGIPFNYGSHTAELYDWEWKWIEKYNDNGENIIKESANYEWKNPEELSKWMKSNIRYDHSNNWRLRSPEEVINSKRGDCHDQSLLEHEVLKSLGYITGRLFMVEYSSWNQPGGATHTACWYEKSNKYYWFENAWGGKEGIHGPYKSLDELKSAIADEWNWSGKNDKLYMGNCSGVKVGMDLGEYVSAVIPEKESSKVFHKNDLAYESCIHEGTKSVIDPNYKPKGKLDLSSFKRVHITDSVINKYKKEYPFLSHVRCKDTDVYICDGYIWFDDDKLVAMVGSCEYRDDHTKWVVSLEITKNYKGYGLSKQILDYATKSMKCKYLSVNKNNNVAKKIYDEYGFRVYQQDKTMYYMTIDSNISSQENCSFLNVQDCMAEIIDYTGVKTGMDLGVYISTAKEYKKGQLMSVDTESDSVLEEKRSEIPTKEFGVPPKRKFPLTDAKHVKSAIKFFNYVDEEDEAELARNIKRKAKDFGVVIRCGKQNRLSKYISKEYVNEFMAVSTIGNNMYAVNNGNIKQHIAQGDHIVSATDSYPYTKKEKRKKKDPVDGRISVYMGDGEKLTVNESAEVVPIYIIAYDYSSVFALALKATTHSHYNHIAIALSPDLEHAYTFARSNKGDHSVKGFTEEPLSQMIKEHGNFYIKVNAVYIPKDAYNKIRSIINDYKKHKDDTTYNYGNLVRGALGIKVDNNDLDSDNMNCSIFVDYMLKNVGVDITDNPNSNLVFPEHLANADMDHDNVVTVYYGNAKGYNKKKVSRMKFLGEGVIEEVKTVKKCNKCGSSNIGVFIKGEPVYICKDCGAYNGIVPFKESIDDDTFFDNLEKQFEDIDMEPIPTDIFNERKDQG